MAYSFSHDFFQERKRVIASAFAQIAALIISVILTIIAWQSLRWIVFIFALLSLAAIGFLSLFLYRRYSSNKVVIEKRDLLTKLSTIQNEISSTKSVIKGSIRTRERIDKERQSKIARREARYSQMLSDFGTKRQSISQVEKDELANTLRRLQEQYCSSGLVEELISNAKISGVGSKLKDRLAANGMRNANDIAVARVSNVPGFGESKTMAVVEWRRSVEYMLDQSKPIELPFEVEYSIKTKYLHQTDAIISEEKTAKDELNSDLDNIKDEAVKNHETNDENEVLARERLELFEPKEKKLEQDLEPYSAITLRNYLLGCLPRIGDKSTSRQTVLLGGASLGIILGFCWQIAAALGSIRHIYIASLPTPTPTFTNTPTSTATFRPTSTLTPTPSPTLTITPSPTITLTPSITPNPTITLTPSITPTPITTLPPLGSIDCVPKNTKREIARVTSIIDGDTIRVAIDGVMFTVRYIGIDAPEGNDRYAYEAGVKNGEYVYGKIVTLVMDVSEVDQYDRLLRYVITDEVFVN